MESSLRERHNRDAVGGTGLLPLISGLAGRYFRARQNRDEETRACINFVLVESKG
jgi:hypothetical protein